MNKSILSLCVAVLFFSAMLHAQISVTYTVNTGLGRTPISPYIYGSNADLTGSENFSSRRAGGNRLTGYNWENNFSNAGSDWNHSSDNYLVSSLSAAQQKIPGVIGFNMIDGNLGKYTLFTLPAAGYVSRDNKGTVLSAETAPSGRWRQVVNKKGSAFTLTPDTSDNSVYVDEFLNYLIQSRGKANAGGMKAYLIDNEPDLWASTHPRIQKQALLASELVTKSIDLAKTVKDMDNTAEVFGYESYGFSGYYNLQSAPDWAMVQGTAKWYLDYYLTQMNAASVTDGRRLLDVLSLHWYSEAIGDHRINDAAATTSNDNVARMQAPRTLWDSGYAENSWIQQWYSAYLPLIPRVTSSINQNYPGTKLAFTEYNYGDFNHPSSGIAQADVLGIFGKYGVYAAHYWQMQSNINYTSAGFKIFRNYDGNNSTFGNTSVYSAMSDKVNSSVYTSINGTNENELYMVVMNKNLTQNINGQFAITSGVTYSTADVWGFDAGSANITQRTAVVSITTNQFSYTIPPLSVFMFKLKTSGNGIADNRPAEINFTLYPNPASGFLNIEGVCAGNREIQMKIYDVAGRALKHEVFSAQGSFRKEINIAALPPGDYNVSFTDEKNNVQQMKFVKR